MLRIDVRGLPELQAKLNRLGKELRPELERTTDKAVRYAHSQVPGYPPPPSGSSYRRTGTLGRSVTTEVRAFGADVVGSIGTGIVYAPWVISTEAVGARGPQAWMHAGRWWTLQGVVAQAREAIIGLYHDMLRRLVAGG